MRHCEVCGQDHAPTCAELNVLVDLTWRVIAWPSPLVRPDLVDLEAMWALPARDPEIA